MFRSGRCRVVETDQVSQGIDFRQLGQRALEILNQVREQQGLIVASNRHAAMMTMIASVSVSIESVQRMSVQYSNLRAKKERLEDSPVDGTRRHTLTFHDL